MKIRKTAAWMQASDDRILEFLSGGSAASVSTIKESEYIDYHYKTICRRCSRLQSAGLIERIGQGVYRITPEGSAYLQGENDLRDARESESPDGNVKTA